MIKSPKERWESEFWVDTNGKIIKYIPMDDEDIYNTASFHTSIARQCFPNVYHGNAAKACENLGWVKVVCPLVKVPLCLKEVNQSQINTLADLGYNWMISDNKKLILNNV